MALNSLNGTKSVKALTALQLGSQQLTVTSQEISSMASIVKSNVDDTAFTLTHVDENAPIEGDNKDILESFISSLKDCLTQHIKKSEDLRNAVNKLAADMSNTTASIKSVIYVIYKYHKIYLIFIF